MNLTGTGFQVWPLTTGNNDDPTLTPGKPTSFNCNTVPDRCSTGPLAYYLPGIEVTFTGTVTQTGAGSVIFEDTFYSALFESIDWIQCWHGNQISSNFVKGVNWLPMQTNSLGFRRPVRSPMIIAPVGAATYPFEVTIFVPAFSGFGRLSLETMQLACLFRNSQLRINAASAGDLTALSAGATMGAVSARASAILVPRQDLVLGPAIEWVLTQIVAGNSASQIQIQNFGTDTQMQGVEPGGGVITLMEMTSKLPQEGVFLADNVTQYQFPWRGQQVTQHIQALVSQIILGMPNDRPNNQKATVSADGAGDYNDYPYEMANAPGAGVGTSIDTRGLRAFIMAQGGDDLDLTALQTADTAQSYFLTVTGGFDAGSHQVLQQFARSWQPAMVQNWLDQITAGGASSLAAYCLQGQLPKATLKRRTPRTKHMITRDQVRYLPWQLI